MIWSLFHTLHSPFCIRQGPAFDQRHHEAFLHDLPEFEGPTYITYDIDCLDPSCAPGTGTPVVGGLTTYEVQRIFRALKFKILVACDVVELSPPYDPVDITAMAVLDAMFEMLCLFKK